MLVTRSGLTRCLAAGIPLVGLGQAGWSQWLETAADGGKPAKEFGGPIQVADDANHLELLYPESVSPTRSYAAASDQPVGTTYHWQIIAGGDKAHIVDGDTGAAVTVQGDAPSAPNAVTLKLTYTNGGASKSWTTNLTVEKPTKPWSIRGLPGHLEVGAAPPWSCHRQVAYHAESQNEYIFVNMLWDEHVTVWPDSPWQDVPVQGGRHTDVHGNLPGTGDNIGWGEYQWHGTDTLLFHYHQVIELGGWQGWDDPFWTNNMAGYDTPNVVVNAAD